MSRRHLFERESNAGSVVTASILAAAAGAAVTYFLYNTEAGEEKREQIKKYAKKAKNKVHLLSDEFTDIGKDVYDDMSSFFKDKYDEIKDLTNDQREELKDKMRERWEETRDEIDVAIERARAM